MMLELTGIIGPNFSDRVFAINDLYELLRSLGISARPIIYQWRHSRIDIEPIVPCTTLIWFGFRANRFPEICKTRRNILVAFWDDLGQGKLNWLSHFEAIICPYKCVLRYITQRAPEYASKCVYLPWVITRRVAFRQPQNRIYIPLYGSTHGVCKRMSHHKQYDIRNWRIIDAETSIADILAECLRRLNRWEVVLDTTYGVWKNYRSVFVPVYHKFYPRLRIHVDSLWSYKLDHISSCKWIFWPARADGLCLPALFAEAIEVPLVAWYNYPQCERFRHGVRLSMGSISLRFGYLPAVVSDDALLLDDLVELAQSSPAEYDTLKKEYSEGRNEVENHRQGFISYWASLLGGTYVEER